jgi:hypothetical protein
VVKPRGADGTVTRHQNLLDLSICLKTLDVSFKPSLASLDWRDSPATLGLEMSEKPSNDATSIVSRSATMTANYSPEGSILSMRARETAHRGQLFNINKRLSSKEPLSMSGLPLLSKIGFGLHPTPILERFLIFSIRWASFRIFTSAFIHVNLRPPDFCQDSREWLWFEKWRPERCIYPPPNGPELGVTVNCSKEAQ